MEIRVLGPLEVLRGGRRVAIGGRRQRSVLAGLVAYAPGGVSTGALIEAVWGDDAPPSARRSLQTYVSRLRGLLGEDAVQRVPDGYRLMLEGDALDAARFEALAGEARETLDRDPAAAWRLLDEALGLWRGDALSDVSANGAVSAYAHRLEETRLRALEDRAAAGLALGRHRELVTELDALATAHPLREGLRLQLMLALYRSGRQSEALDVAADLRRTLADELGLDPSPAVQDLERRILHHDPGLAAPRPGAEEEAGPVTPGPTPSPDGPPDVDVGTETGAVVRNPYKGLRAFGEADAADFFGREEVVERVVERLDRGDRLVSIVGGSGVGKSSLVLAGVVPRLRAHSADRRPLVAVMTPGHHPFARLEAALRRLGGAARIDPSDELAILRAVLTTVPDEHTDLVLVVDQFEELLAGGATTAGAFLAGLAEALEDPHGQLTVVLTLRSDFLDRALDVPGLADAIAEGLLTVPPMSTADVRAAIVGPAEGAGLRVDPQLVDELVGAVSRRPGSLPLLQFVLAELTDRATDGRLDLDDLRRAGGFEGALTDRAEAAYGSLGAAAREAARRLMLRLATIDERGEATRRSGAWDDLANGGEGAGAALEAFTRERLLTVARDDRTGSATVEVTHEAVLRAWPRCAAWIEDARDGLRTAAQLEVAAAEWDAAGRSSDYLLTGTRLDRSVEAGGATTRELSELATAYLVASIDHREARRAADAARDAHERDLERRAVSRLRALAGVLTVLVVAGGALTLLATRQTGIAERERAAALAVTNALLLQQLSDAAVSEVGRDPELGLLLALHAVRVAQDVGAELSVETQEALHWALQGLRIPYPVEDGPILRLEDARGPRGAYALPLEDLVALAVASAPRELDEAECRRFFPRAGCPTLEALDLEALPAAAPPVTGVGAFLEGTQVEVGGPWTDLDAEVLREEFAAFRRATGITVVYHELSTLEEIVAEGRGPLVADVVALPQPASVAAEARAGRLVDLGRYLDPDQLLSDYGPELASLVTVGPGGTHPSPEGMLAAVPGTVGVKSLIWYSPRHFEAAGYDVPATWDELEALADRMVEDGRTPWCFGFESGSASGWPVTDIVENLLLQAEGTAVYDGWVRGDIGFQDPRVARAFERAGALIFPDGRTHGGPTGAARTPFGRAVQPIVEDDPGCWMHLGAHFLANFWSVGEELAFFPLPPATPDAEPLLLGGGDFLVAYADRPEVRALVRHFASEDFGGELLYRRDPGATRETPTGWLMANRRFDTARYPDPWRRNLAETLVEALEEDRYRFDGSDLLPPDVGQGRIYDAMMRYVREGPDSLPGILAELDAVMQASLTDASR